MKTLWPVLLFAALLSVLSVSCKKSEPDNPAAPGPVSYSGRHSGNWEWQSPLPQGNDLEDVAFINDAEGWAVGSNGAVVHTSNHGNTWVLQPSGTTNRLTRVQFYDANRGWALEGATYGPYSIQRNQNAHAILRTVDGGRHWSRTVIGEEDLGDFHFWNADTGWTVGANGEVWRTTDGGANWALLFQRPLAYFTCVQFVSRSVGYAGGVDSAGVYYPYYTVLLRTSNGGMTWQEVEFPSSSGVIGDVAFRNAQTGYVALRNNGGVYLTTNGGAHWEVAGSSYYYFSRLAVSDDSTVWGVTRSGELYQSLNRGQSWTMCIEEGARGVTFANPNTGWYVGDFGEIARTGNGGTEWNSQVFRVDSLAIKDIVFTDADHGWAADSGGKILLTSNGGVTWNTVIDIAPVHPERILFLDSLRALAVGGYYAGNSYPSTVFLKSVDGGQTWMQNLVGVDGYRWDMDFCADGQNGWAVGGMGTILHTTDGGDSWEIQSGGDQILYLSGVSALNPQTAWACSGGDYYYSTSSLAHTTDGGRTWINRQMAGVRPLWDIEFVDELNGWVTSGSGSILHTSDGGASWMVQPTGARHALTRIAFADRGTGIAVGDSGTVVVSVDGGESWQVEEGVTANPLQAVFFTDPDHGWVGGPSGTILRFLGTASTF